MLDPDDAVDAEAAPLLEGAHRPVERLVEDVQRPDGSPRALPSVSPSRSSRERISATARPRSPTRNVVGSAPAGEWDRISLMGHLSSVGTGLPPKQVGGGFANARDRDRPPDTSTPALPGGGRASRSTAQRRCVRR